MNPQDKPDASRLVDLASGPGPEVSRCLCVTQHPHPHPRSSHTAAGLLARVLFNLRESLIVLMILQ